MTTVRRSLLFAFVERYLLIALQIVSFALIARLLTPAQVGLYSVTLALVSIAQVVRDFGVAGYLVQAKSLRRDQIASALGVSLLLGVTLFVLINLAAPFVARFYADEEMTVIIRIISLNFLVLPFGSVCLALLRRQMHFDRLLPINLTAAAVNATTCIGLAWAGFGAVSLACGEIATNLVVAIGAWLARGELRPVRPSLKEWREVVDFGGKMTASNVVTSVSMDINDLVVGKTMSFADVGFLSRAQGLVNLFHRDVMNTIRNVAFPAFSKAHREGGNVEQQFVASLTAVTAIAWPFYGFVAIFPLEILRIVFGPQWDAAAPLVPIFCLAGAFAALSNLVPAVMLATGAAGLVAAADLVIQPVRALLLTGVILYFRDLTYFAWSFALVAALAVPYFYAFKQRCLPTDLATTVRAVGSSALVAGVALLPAVVIASTWATEGVVPWPAFLFAGVSSVGCWVITLLGTKHFLAMEAAKVWRARRPQPAAE